MGPNDLFPENNFGGDQRRGSFSNKEPRDKHHAVYHRCISIYVFQPFELTLTRKKHLQVVKDVENVILRRGFDPQIVQVPEKLGAMICTMIAYMEKHLPQDKIFIFSL
jgi:hypothetical protein